MYRFEGKAVLVTGAAGGIGASLVRMLRAEGARVAAADRDVKDIKAEAHLPAICLIPPTPMVSPWQRGMRWVVSTLSSTMQVSSHAVMLSTPVMMIGRCLLASM